MGYFSRLHAEILEFSEQDDDFWPEPNYYEKALENGEEFMGTCKFVESCKKFYKKNKFLTEKQIYRLNNPKF